MRELPLILFNNNEKGENKVCICKDAVEKTFNDFFSLDLTETENALNDRRKFLILQWVNKGLHNKLIYKNKETEFTNEKGICELSGKFKLFIPRIIEVSIKNGFAKNPAEIRFTGGEFDVEYCTFRFEKVYLDIFIDLLDLVNKNLVWDRNPNNFVDILYHELLHICGDVICDGIIRHNFVGIDIIKRLLNREDSG